jgi:hypothetical protein
MAVARHQSFQASISARKGVDPKPRPNHRLYIEALRRMTPQQRLAKAFELSALARQAFVQGLRRRFPDLPEQEFHRLLLARLEKCHNRKY